MVQSATVRPADTLIYDQERRLAVDGEPLEMAPGLFGVRFELPFVLDHVNIWLVAADEGWTLIDAGLGDRRSRERWHGLEPFMAGRPVTRVLATHFHPDHMGLAGWWCARSGAELWTSRTEFLQARALALDTGEDFVAAGRTFDHRAGLADDLADERAARGNVYRPRVSTPPPSFRRVQDADQLSIGGLSFQVIVGRGHAPEMLCLYCAQRNLLIAADQVLPRISPNVGVWPGEPEANPLAEFLESLGRLRQLPDDCLVLPSHGHVFRGLHARIDQLVAHHRDRLDAAISACQGPSTAVEIMPNLFDRELDVHQLGFALGETLAHLNLLVEDGELKRSLGDDGRVRFVRR